MRRTIIASTFIAAALFGAPALAQSSPVVGAWATTATTPQGTFEATMTVAEADGAYTVEFEQAPPPGAPAGPAPEDTITDIVVDGGTFSFKRSLTTPQGPIELTYAGTVEGDALTATATSSFGSIPITGTRK